MILLTQVDFKSDQKKFQRVAEAYRSKEQVVRSQLAAQGISLARLEIFIRIFKQEKKVELWARNKGEPFIFLTSYPVCANSGTLGPKRRQGDNQTPEGFYVINTFNPASTYYLSLGINYPNSSDKILCKSGNLGGDIFIHGNCVTIGCIPITDDKIKELYIYAVEAKNNGQELIPVHIFPTALTEINLNRLQSEFGENKNLLSFWNNLKPGFDYFEKWHLLPSITVDPQGNYQVR